MNTTTYKGYLGPVAFSEKDNVFFVKAGCINGLVNFGKAHGPHRA